MLTEREKKCFECHKATLSDYGTIKMLDFKRPESSYYRIRFLFEEDYYRLHISGDLGSLTAANCTNMTYEKFAETQAISGKRWNATTGHFLYSMKIWPRPR